MTKTTINLTGFRLSLETHLWVYLEACFQNDLTEEGTPTLKMGNAFWWAGVSRVKKKKRLPGRKHPPPLLPGCRNDLTRCFTLLLL